MKRDERDEAQLRLILCYCGRLEEALERFGREFETFDSDAVFQDSCALCLVQVGEAVNRLSQEFKERHPEIEWQRIYGMRCHIVHGYEMFDAEIAWDAIENGIPPLRAFCDEWLAQRG